MDPGLGGKMREKRRICSVVCPISVMSRPCAGEYSRRKGTLFDVGSNDSINLFVCSIPAVFGLIPFAYILLTFLLRLSLCCTKDLEDT